MTHYSLKTEYGAADVLFGAIVTLDRKRFRELKESGVKLTEDVRNVLSNGTGKARAENPAYKFWFALVREIKTMTIEDFSEIAAMLRAETDKPLYYSETLWLWGNKLAFEPGFFEVTLENFDQKRMSKKRTMKRIIDSNKPSCLPICEKHGWLKNPKTRDELIDYASENGKTEAVAWLLEFKNRTADLAAERAKAEKKAERELNENPNTLTSLKKNWGFKEKKDGTLIITSYKGNSTVLAVPAEIGGAKVTEIDDWALSPHALRIKEPTREFRKTITKITLPEGLKKIGESAFRDLVSLESVNIPKTVRSIGEDAFSDCISLKTVIVPKGVRDIGDNAFSVQSAGFSALEYVELPSTLKYFKEDCKWYRVFLFRSELSPHLVVGVPHAPHVEEFCEHNNIKFRYTDEL